MKASQGIQLRIEVFYIQYMEVLISINSFKKIGKYFI